MTVVKVTIFQVASSSKQYKNYTHLVTHLVWPDHHPENPPGRLRAQRTSHEEAHPSFPYSA